MTSVDDLYDKEFYEASEALRFLFDLEKIPAEDRKRMKDSMIADILGDRPIQPPQSLLAPEAVELLYAIQELYGSVHRFQTFEKMFRYYPWRGSVSRSDHLQSTYYLFVNECYVLKERLGSYFAKAKTYARKRKLTIDLRHSTKQIMGLHKRVFGNAVRSRGTHVHDSDFLPRDIRRVSLIRSLAFAYGVKDKEAFAMWDRFHRLVFSQVRKDWVKNCQDAQKAAREIAKLAFRETKPIWLALSRER